MKNENINTIRQFFICLALLFLCIGNLYSQSRGPIGPGGQTTNCVKEHVYLSKDSIGSTQATYFDGLGRELKKINSYTHSKKDIVTLMEYDNYGRVSRKYLPYPNSPQGSFYPTDKDEQKAYYQTNYNSIYGYSQVVYENTTINNVIEESLPGDSWKIGGGHTQRNQITKNTSTDKLKVYSIVDDTTVQYKYDYDDFPGRLIKKETIDPQGDKVYEYYDIKEKLIAKETRTTSDAMYTYYLYDDLGQVRYVIPPIADATFKLGDRKNLQELKKYCFYTEYDELQRPYKNYIPGAGYTINLYDKKNRLVLSQNAVMRSQGKWMFTKYDEMSRQVITGVCGGTETQHKAALEVQTIFGENRGAFAHGYTNQTYPIAVTGNDYLAVTYYDNYDWQGESQETLSVSASREDTFTEIIDEEVTGRITGAKHKVMGIAENKWLLSAKYYDDQYNEIQTVSQLYPQGIERIFKQYDYVGNLTHIREKQTIGAKQEGFDRYLEYDKLGQLSNVKQKMLGYVSTELVTIAKYTYNDLRQVVEKTIHNGVDTTRYLYRMDGQNIGANSPLFSYKLYFDTKPANLVLHVAPRYDGNICFMEWKNGNTLGGYRYNYDELKQLKDADYLYEQNSEWIARKGYRETVTYDLNGNITSLKRTDRTGDRLHDIDYEYDGNRLDVAYISHMGGEVLGNQYVYDDNGNMIYDGSKDVNISYNILNLPERIFAGTEEVSYIYSASGQKLATKAGSSTTYYRGSFIYNNDELDHILQPEGIIRKMTSAYVYYYAKQDHLGSIRVLCHEANGKMIADQTTNFYPFGLSFYNNSTNVNRYLYSGKELQDQLVNGNRLMLYDYSARYYDPMLGRWFNVDPALQLVNPYLFCGNNPLMYVDPNGESFFLFCLLSAVIFAAIDYGVQVAVNHVNGHRGREAWLNKIDFLDVGMSFVAGGLMYALPGSAMWIGCGGEFISNGVDWYGDGQFDVVGAGIGFGQFAMRTAVSAASIAINQGVFKQGFKMQTKNKIFSDRVMKNKLAYNSIFDFTEGMTTNFSINAFEGQHFLDNKAEIPGGGLTPLNPTFPELTKSTYDKNYKKKVNEKYIFAY